MTKVKKHHWLFRLWIKIRGLLALVVVLAGLAVGLLSLLLPFESLYQDRLEKFLQQQWGLQVQVEKVTGSWSGYGPYFLLSNLKLTGKQSVQLKSANLSVNIYQMLIPGGRTGVDLSINKAELDMIHSVDGANITINNDADEARLTEMLDKVLTTGSLRVDEMVLNLANEAGDVLLEGITADVLLEQDKTHRALQLVIENEENNQRLEIKSKGIKTHSLTRDAQWYLNFNQFSLEQFKDLVGGAKLPNGQLNGELWLTAESGAINTVVGHLSWVNQSQNLEFDLSIKQLGQGNDWQASLKLENLSVGNTTYDDLIVGMQKSNRIIDLKTASIPIALVVQMAADMDLLTSLKLSDSEYVEGMLTDIEMSYDVANSAWLGGRFNIDELNINQSDFNVKQLAGQFQFEPGIGRLLIDSALGSLAVPSVYRGQLDWQQLNSQIDINWSDDAPKLVMNNFWCQCTDFNLQMWSEFKFDEILNMKLNSRLSAVDVKSLSKYWPHNVWKPNTIDWLDRGLLGGEVETGYVFVHGDMVPKAFKKGSAQFISRAYTENVSNLFHPEWPVVKNIDAIAIFDHDQIKVHVIQAETLGIDVKSAQVDIDSLDQGIVSIDMNAHTQNNHVLEYIQTSPLAKNLALSDNFQISGRQNIDLNFDVSIKSDIKQEFDPQGVIEFTDGQFLTDHFSIDGINGPVKLDGYHLTMNDLPARLNQAAVKLNGEIITKSESGVSVDVDLTGTLNADYLLELVQQDLPIAGESEWLINIRSIQKQLVMTAKSALSGIAIQLPAPLNKEADEDRFLEVKCSIPCLDSSVDINFDDRIKSTLMKEAGQFHLTKLQFLAHNDDEQTVDNALFGGEIEALDLDRWMELLAKVNSEAEQGNNSAGSWPVDEIKLNIKQLIFMSRRFNDINLYIKRLDSSYEIDVDSQAMKGRVLLDDDLTRKGIVAEFDHLNWHDSLPSDESNNQESTPSKIPDIHLWSEQFSYKGVPLGAMRMEMRNVADGINLEQLSLKSTLAEINISGTWNKAQGEVGFSDFNVVMFSEKIADFLKTVGFSAPISNAQTLIEMKAQWAGVPSQFNIANIDGDLNIKIGQGQVLDQEPGFGRVLGLFNLTNLPRRLILDFRDVLADGLLFSSMEGHFEINSGVANTQDFLIKASSAKIHIVGDVGFADQSYEQTITIRPQIGKTLPTLGAIAGGPVGAAAGFLVQGLFDKQLKNRNEIIYRVTGTWDEPLIELISNE